jgi:hypothetical protein
LQGNVYRVGVYSRVDDKENSFESEADYFIPDAEKAGRRRRQGKIWKGIKLLIWVGQALLLAAHIYGLTVTMRTVNRDSVSSKLNSLPCFRT